MVLCPALEKNTTLYIMYTNTFFLSFQVRHSINPLIFYISYSIQLKMYVRCMAYGFNICTKNNSKISKQCSSCKNRKFGKLLRVLLLNCAVSQ